MTTTTNVSRRHSYTDRIALITSITIMVLITISLLMGSLRTDIVAHAQDTSAFTFTAAGDYGATSRTNAVLAAMAPATSGSSFNLALGDLSYGNLTPESAWCNLVKGAVGDTFPFEIISGNHEDDGPAGNNIDSFAQCLPDRLGTIQGRYSREYYYDYPASTPLARFILLSPNLTFLDEGTYDYSAGTAHYTWVANAIDSARAAGVRWIVVGIHKPCLSMGKYSCSISPDLVNLLVAKKVDLILHGHEHTYQRSKQLALGTSCPAIPQDTYNANCVVDDGADTSYVKNAGSIFAIVGTGGAGLYAINTADPEAGYFANWSGTNSNPAWGFLKVRVTNTQLSAQFMPVSGSFTEAFTITDQSQPMPTPPTSTATATPIVSTSIITSQVTISSDDAEEAVGTRQMSLKSTDLELVTDGTNVQTVGMRFTNIAIPQAATITGAYVEFEVDRVQTGATSLSLFAQAADNAPTFSPLKGNISSRAKTTAQIAWNAIPAWNTAGAKKQSPDLVPIIQEIINRQGWKPGNALAIIITGSGRRAAQSFNGSPAGAPTLIVTYSVPTPAPTATSTPTATATVTPTPVATTVSLTAIGDTYIRSSTPNTNYGSKTTLTVDASPGAISYLVFDLAALDQRTITSAKLRIKAGADVSNAVQTIKSVNDTSWSETTMTYNSRPALGATINSFTSATANTWIEIDVTQAVATHQGQLLALGIDQASNDGATFHSREAVDKPTLVVVYQ